jgi:hypothetical protein
MNPNSSKNNSEISIKVLKEEEEKKMILTI